jgi:alanyl-tRNA synthetase
VAWVQQADSRLRDAADSLHVGVEQVGERLEKLQQERKEMTQTVKNLKTRLSVAEAQSSLAKAREIGTFKVAHVRLDGVPGKELRTVAENLRDQLGGPGSIMVCGAAGDKVSLIVACTKTASNALHAGKTVGELASFVGGRGGGRPDFAQAGGGDANGLDAARDRFFELAETAFG